MLEIRVDLILFVANFCNVTPLNRVDGKLKLDLDEEQLKLPFLPTVLVSRSYPLQLSNLTTVVSADNFTVFCWSDNGHSQPC